MQRRADRDDFIIAVRSALLKKGTQQKFSLLALIVISGILLSLEVFDNRYLNFFRSGVKDIIYRSVTNATREMVREWLDQNLASIAKEVINEALDKLSKNARN